MESAVFTIYGYVDGYMAPGYKDLEKYFASIHFGCYRNFVYGFRMEII